MVEQVNISPGTIPVSPSVPEQVLTTNQVSYQGLPPMDGNKNDVKGNQQHRRQQEPIRSGQVLQTPLQVMSSKEAKLNKETPIYP